MQPGVRKACIVKGTHVYEKGAHQLGEPLVDELRHRGINAVLHPVPYFAADTSREENGVEPRKTSYWKFRKERRDWWRSISKGEDAPVFSLHSYPHTDQTWLNDCRPWMCIGSVGTGYAPPGIFLLPRIDLRQALRNRPLGTMRHLAALWKKGISVWEDASRYHSYLIEVPAVPDTSDEKGLRVDMERTKAMGFTGDGVVKTLAGEIEHIIGSLQA
jgi:hypothetical protein